MADDILLIEEIGLALYGQRWRHDMSMVLDVNQRTLRRWTANPDLVPAGCWAELRRVVANEAGYYDELQARIAERAKNAEHKNTL